MQHRGAAIFVGLLTLWGPGSGCSDTLDLRPGYGAPPLQDPELGSCSVEVTTAFLGREVQREEWRYDGDGRRVEVEFDDDADGIVDRVHVDTWDSLNLVRTAHSKATDSAYAWLETFEYSETTLLSRRLSYDRRAGAGRERKDTLFATTYDLGLPIRIDEDDGADGTIDRTVTLEWEDDLSGLVEAHEDVVYERVFDAGGRVLTQRERRGEEGDAPDTLATFTYHPEQPAWPATLFVDIGVNANIEVVVVWSYDCP